MKPTFIRVSEVQAGDTISWRTDHASYCGWIAAQIRDKVRPGGSVMDAIIPHFFVATVYDINENEDNNLGDCMEFRHTTVEFNNGKLYFAKYNLPRNWVVVLIDRKENEA
jgi:hypothetical protein